MNGRKHFQPNGRCGNCQFFRHTERDKAEQLIEEAHCSKDMDPKTCGDEFKSRNKKIKQKKRKKKRWQLEAR